MREALTMLCEGLALLALMASVLALVTAAHIAINGG